MDRFDKQSSELLPCDDGLIFFCLPSDAVKCATCAVRPAVAQALREADGEGAKRARREALEEAAKIIEDPRADRFNDHAVFKRAKARKIDELEAAQLSAAERLTYFCSDHVPKGPSIEGITCWQCRAEAARSRVARLRDVILRLSLHDGWLAIYNASEALKAKQDAMKLLVEVEGE